MQLRSARRDEAETLEALINSVFQGDPEAFGWRGEGHLLEGPRITAEEIRELVARPDTVLLVAEDERGASGCVQLTRKDTFAYLGLLTVRHDLHGQGVGRQLLEEAGVYVRDHWSLSEIRMSVFAQRPELIQWYERCGYTRTGERQPYPKPGAEGKARVSGLYFEVLSQRLT